MIITTLNLYTNFKSANQVNQKSCFKTKNKLKTYKTDPSTVNEQGLFGLCKQKVECTYTFYLE